MRRLRRWAVTLGLLPVLWVTACSAVTTGSVPTTGPLFLPGLSFHACTASVVSSPTHDLVITAAHCVFGTGIGVTFVPGSVGGSAPYGRWKVSAAYVDPAWKASRDPLRDVAILRVEPQPIRGVMRRVEELAGGNRLVQTPARIGPVIVPAYLVGAGDSPITCLANTYRTGRYSTFNCGGYASGVSGAPWLKGSTVLGVIGVPHQGGCLPGTSYSALFDATTLRTFNRAVGRAPADTLPPLGSDGC